MWHNRKKPKRCHELSSTQTPATTLLLRCAANASRVCKLQAHLRKKIKKRRKRKENAARFMRTSHDEACSVIHLRDVSKRPPWRRHGNNLQASSALSRTPACAFSEQYGRVCVYCLRRHGNCLPEGAGSFFSASRTAFSSAVVVVTECEVEYV